MSLLKKLHVAVISTIVAFGDDATASIDHKHKFEAMIPLPSIISSLPSPGERSLHLTNQCDIERSTLDVNITLQDSYDKLSRSIDADFEENLMQYCNATDTNFRCKMNYADFSDQYASLCRETEEGEYNAITVTSACTVNDSVDLHVESEHLPVCIGRSCTSDEVYNQVVQKLIGMSLHMSSKEGTTCNFGAPTIEFDTEPSIIRQNLPSSASHYQLMDNSVSTFAMVLGLFFFII